MSEYSAERRTKRTRQRAVMQGTERFEADSQDLALDPAEQVDPLPQEIPPHWGEFNQQE